MKKHKPTVMYAVCAYNEAANIVAHLKSVISQDEKGFTLTKILVVSDGSTDETVKLVNSLKNKKIEVWNFQYRAGKTNRLNQLYRYVTADILVQSDADVVLAHPLVIDLLIKPILENNKVAMCGGDPTPLPSQTFTESAVNITTEIYRKFRHIVRGGHNLFSADGRLLAFKKTFIRNLTVPQGMIANDAYTYLACLSQGFAYRFVPEAVVFYRLPQTLSDQINQNTRFVAAPQRMKKYFLPLLVKKEFSIPSRTLWLSMLKQFLRFPIHSLYIYAVNTYCRIRSNTLEPVLNAKWKIATSSKQLSKNA